MAVSSTQPVTIPDEPWLRTGAQTQPLEILAVSQ